MSKHNEFVLAKALGGGLLMFEEYDEAYEKGGTKGLLKQFARHLFWIILAGIFISLPCFLCARIIGGIED